jgi:hypothetical protein
VNVPLVEDVRHNHLSHGGGRERGEREGRREGGRRKEGRENGPGKVRMG